MRWTAGTVVCAAAAGGLLAQAPAGPVVSPRGVVNAFTQQPAPSRVSAGGLIWIHGLSLGPAEGVKATGSPWPTRLADPPIEVLVNGRAAPLYSASPGRIVAQIPWETNNGLAEIVVRRGEARSRPARIFIDPMRPSIRTDGDTGFGAAAALSNGSTLTLPATGLGQTEPRAVSGETASLETRPQSAVRAHVGGLPAEAQATLSTERVGEFDIRITLPADARPGDVISVEAGNQPANRTIYRKTSAPEMQFLLIPEGAPELRAISGSDLRGNYIVMNGARNAEGCYPSYVFDFGRQLAAAVDGCLTSANRNLQTPFSPANEGSAVGALVGPPEGEAPNGVSSKLRLFHPGSGDSMEVMLPSPAVTLNAAPGGNFIAQLAGTPPRPVMVDSETGEISDLQMGGAGGGGGTGGAVILNPNFTIDLGDGLTHLLTAPANIGQGALAVVVGDNADKPARAKLALLNQRGDVTGTRDFPEGWLPVVAPSAPAPPGVGPGGIPPGGQIPPGLGGLQQRFRVTSGFDGPTRTLYVLSRKGDEAHGLTAFRFPDAPTAVVEFPASNFAPACVPNIPLFNLELARRLAIPTTTALESQVRNPCPAQGYVVMDLADRSLTAIRLPGAGQLSVASLEDLNDYIYGSNTDSSRQNRADTLYVLDGVTASAFRMDLPPDVATFTALQPIPQMGILVGLAARMQPGDAGLIIFDMEQAQARLLPTPEGFAQVQTLGMFTATRKLVARGNKPGNSGSQLLIYDLLTGDLVMPPNPEGVAWVGAVPPQAPGGGQPPQPGAQIPALQRPNVKANAVAAVGYGADRRQVGVLLLRIH